MAQVPVYNQPTVADKHIAMNYQNLNINGDMIGENIVRANYVLARAGKNFGEQIEKQIDDYNKTKITDLSNKLDAYNQQALYDKENGYFSKTGKNAAGQSGIVLQGYDDYAADLMKEYNFSGRYKDAAESTILAKRNHIFAPVNEHDLKQTKEWQNTVYAEKQNNILNQGIQDRNDDNLVAENLRQGLNAVELQGQNQNWDSDTIKFKKQQYTSQFHEGIVHSLIADGNPKAKAYLEAHKSEILPDRLPSLMGSVRNGEIKYLARDYAQEIFSTSKSADEAIKRAEAIEDIDVSDATLSRVRRYYSEQEFAKNEAEKEALDGFYNTALAKMQSGETMSYDDIPDGVDAKTRLSLMNYINQNGQPQTDNEVWETLYDMSVNNAQGFANEDLNKYRGFLSDGEYKQFLKKQQEIQDGKFYSQIKDDDKMIDAALKEMGLNKGKKNNVAYSEIRSMVREFEARKGRKITDNELNNIVNSLGYKDGGVQMYKQLEKGMAERTGFVRDVMNDFAYYQSKHNGEFPPDDEKMKIINKRITEKAVEHKTQAEQRIDTVKYNALTMRNINNTVAKPNEQKVLTYFADNQIPSIGQQLGLKLTVTSRYRNQQGSHHKEGRACDISLSEHSANNRIRIYEKLLSLPNVHALGCSDPVILSHFNGNRKLVDERKYDREHGTNHVNHVHVTLINTPTQSNNNIIAQNGNYRF